MPGVRYEPLKTSADCREAPEASSAKAASTRCSAPCCQKVIGSLLLILLYFALSIGLTFYQRWLLKGFHFPLSVVIYHLVMKFCLSALCRGFLFLYTGTPRVSLNWFASLRSVAPTGLASGIDVGFSNWGLQLVTVSLYTMTKSTTIIFILGFAILLGLEKKSWSLVMIVVMISTGLVMFTYKATQFDTMGFCLLLVASLASGLRWTFAQVLMQKSKLGLNNPLDMVYYVQPWMLLSVLPLAVGFEGLQLVRTILNLPNEQILPYVFKVSFGAFLAFTMELSEYLVVTHTSSLTLSVAGIFKEMVILVLAVELTGDLLSPINVMGLLICLLGISGHIIHKFLTTSSSQQQVTSINYLPSKLSQGFVVTKAVDVNSFDSRDISLFRRNPVNKKKTEHCVPLLSEEGDALETALLSRRASNDSQSADSDAESSRVLYDVLQRRDNVK